MIRRAQAGPVTFSDFLEQIREDQKADLIDGVIHLASPENTDHNDLISWLDTIFRLYLEHTGLGRVFIDRVAFRLSEKNTPEPDVAVVRAARAHLVKRGYVEGPPDLAVEIVSPDSGERDYEDKRRLYEDSGVEEYWIVDPDESTATFLVRQGQVFAEVLPENYLYRSSVLPGLEFDVRWLWQRPLPPVFPIVQLLLELKGP